jgi:hypothetical protein
MIDYNYIRANHSVETPCISLVPRMHPRSLDLLSDMLRDSFVDSINPRFRFRDRTNSNFKRILEFAPLISHRAIIWNLALLIFKLKRPYSFTSFPLATGWTAKKRLSPTVKTNRSTRNQRKRRKTRSLFTSLKCTSGKYHNYPKLNHFW